MFLCLSFFKPHLDFFQLSHLASTSRRLYFATSLIIEISVSVVCAFTIRLQKPPTIRLVDTKSHSLDLRSRSSTPFNPLGVDDNSQIPASNSRRSTPLPADTDLLASLSLSSKPVITPTNPVFGLPSLLASSSRPEAHPINSMDDDPIEVDRDEMAMDWTPIRPTNRLNVPNPGPGRPKQSSDSDDGAWLRPQRFFAPEKPTGLEGLFERTSIIDETDGETRQPTASTYHFVPRWTYTLAMIPLILSAFAWVAWRGRGGGPPTVTEFPLPYPSYSYHNSQYANINGEQ
ncbi:hypothetical protein ONZ45_g8414 [Pleurotus djamor]|nr:hypothetical protein ONZ45_g8414 [Pleurotus djamor]